MTKHDIMWTVIVAVGVGAIWASWGCHSNAIDADRSDPLRDARQD